MPKCKAPGCNKLTRHKNTKKIYCPMHLSRLKRNGHLGLRDKSFHKLEKLPHKFVDGFVLKNCSKMIDTDIAKYLQQQGFKGATVWIVKYRRRKLGVKKYLYGEVKKHKAWVRQQAIKKYGNACELCGYNLHIETHHIIPKHKGGTHTVNNLIVLCSNCHTLITNKRFELKSRKDIKKVSKKIKRSLKLTYPYLE
ncbi:HNH endonuclease [Patescibacteria group bacterium]|nr:HNH endonuclease [Patescibacteria group bacterium]MBU4512542.1 HNH endonuclease [Patescibacteria group bacterium]MCG2693072.1 HNH endonuclease [Candidatus Parcubacteria bacterium]